jgi:putative ABC transport system ATP-binding protein
MITLENINKVFYTRDVETSALSEVNLKIEKGEFVSIMGPSGCGKSTLLNIMGLLDKPTGGKMFVNGTDVATMSDRQTADFRNQTLGFIFQSFHLIPALNVHDNVMLPLYYRRGVSSAERKQLSREALEKVGLSHRMMHFPAQLSGGQCQRVAIARALVGKSEILLADEPTGNLDSKMGEEIITLLTNINRAGTTIVMVTHDNKMAAHTHRIVRLFDGKIQ